MRQRWKDAESRGLAKSEEWLPKSVPFQIKYIWNWFLELHVSRHFDPGAGRSPPIPLPITYQDMVSWSMLTERKLGPFEIGVIRQLDQRYFYVLMTPNGGTQFLSEKEAESNVKSILRAMAASKNKQGVAELPTKAPTKIPVITLKKN